MRTRSVISSVVLFALLLPAVTAEPPEGYYRFPALYGDKIAFGAEGDLWIVPSKGGTAQRLTTHQGEERYPRISPDGTVLAYSASYEGPTELYTMPLSGGLPDRQTYEASQSIPVGWTPDGRILYATGEYSTLPGSRLVALDPVSGNQLHIALAQASDGSFDASGKTLFFARPDFHRNNTKRYQGGTARNIWRFAEGDSEAVNLTADFAGENHSPMWWKKRVYFVCDRD
jgi:tricorn protease